MIQSALIIGVLSLAAGEVPEERQLALTTQDTNGFHILTAVEIGGRGYASVWRKVEGKDLERRQAIYPVQDFEKRWLAITEGALDPYISPPDTPGTEDIGAARNYVVAVRFKSQEGVVEKRTYRIPKCEAPESVKVLVDDIALDFLPEGSPGLFEPCEVRAN